jgi:hypothetical protein
MVRCDEFYEKWKRCGNFCEKHPRTAEQIDEYLSFIEQLEEDERMDFAQIPEATLRPLINEQDPVVREKAIESIKKSVESRKSLADGKFTTKLPTGRDISLCVKKSREELYGKQKDEPEEIDTGLIFSCPICNVGFKWIHIEPTGEHKHLKHDPVLEDTKAVRIKDDTEDITEFLRKPHRYSRSTMAFICKHAGLIMVHEEEKFKLRLAQLGYNEDSIAQIIGVITDLKNERLGGV